MQNIKDSVIDKLTPSNPLGLSIFKHLSDLAYIDYYDMVNESPGDLSVKFNSLISTLLEYEMDSTVCYNAVKTSLENLLNEKD